MAYVVFLHHLIMLTSNARIARSHLNNQLNLVDRIDTLCRGVHDIGTGLQAVAAAITDPETVSAFQAEHRDGETSQRTFYGGMHELSGGVTQASYGMQALAKVMLPLLRPPTPPPLSSPPSALLTDCEHELT